MQRRIIISLFVFCLTLVLTACSTVENFIIVNNSDDVLRIEYQSRNIPFNEFKKISADKITSPEKNWQELSADEYEIDAQTKTVKTKIAPKEALLIDKEVNYQGHDEESFNITNIKLLGKNGVISFEGKQAQTAFEKQENRDYVIFYK
jgi:hypothetical protein